MTTTLDAPAISRATTKTRELRLAVTGLELRAGSTASDPVKVTGYACTTETPYEMEDWAGTYTEIVRAGAFTKTLAEQADVRLLLNHDGIPLARTKSGTLNLAEDEAGLKFDADLDPSSSVVQDVRSAMQRGDLDQCSFAFRVTRQEWSRDYEQRDILEVELYDVSLVTYPANPTTSASLRSALMAELRSMVPAARAKAVLAEVRAGELSPAGAELLTGILEAATTLEERADPTNQDAGIADKIGAAHAAVSAALAAQAHDDDNASDPDDAQVLKYLKLALSNLTSALGAQGKDGAADPPPDDQSDDVGTPTGTDGSGNRSTVIGLELASAIAERHRARARTSLTA